MENAEDRVLSFEEQEAQIAELMIPQAKDKIHELLGCGPIADLFPEGMLDEHVLKANKKFIACEIKRVAKDLMVSGRADTVDKAKNLSLHIVRQWASEGLL